MVADHMINYEQTMKSPANNAKSKIFVNKISISLYINVHGGV